MKKIAQSVFLVSLFVSLSGCIAASVVSATIGATTTVIGGAIDVIDAVTPDIIDGNDEQAKEDDKDNGKI